MPLLACEWSQNYRGEGRGEKGRGEEERGGEERGEEERRGGGKEEMEGGKEAERRREEREGKKQKGGERRGRGLCLRFLFFYLASHVHWKNIALLADLHFHL